MAHNNQQTDIGEIRTALHAIPPDIPRDEWAKTGMAIKAEFGESGFELWDTWSQGGKSYNQRDSIATWKSIKPSAGGKSVGIGSLIRMAKSHGYKPQKRTQTSQSAKPKAVATVKQENAPAVDSDAIAKAQAEWDAATPVESHPYLTERQVKSHGLRVSLTGNLLVPVKRNGAIVSLEPIYNQGGEWKKGTVKGTSKTDGYFVVGDASGANRIYIGEGYSTCATVYEVTGHPAVVTFGCGNLSKVAQTIRNEFPASEIVLLADDDIEVMGNPGRTKSTAAAVAVGGLVATPAFGENRPAGATDFNDMRTLLGDDAVRSCLEENAVAPAKSSSDGLKAGAELLRNGISIQRGSDWLKNTKPIEWLLRGLLVRGYLYTFTSPTNHGKTTVMANLIAQCLKGADFGEHKNDVGPMNVLLLCGENDVDTAHKMMGAFAEFGVTQDDLVKFYVIDKAFPMSEYGDQVVDYANTFGVDFHLVVPDTWQAYWSGGAFNENEAQLAHAKAMRVLTTMNGRPTVIVPAHPVKNASKDNLVPYGGGAAMNELDGNFEGWNDSGIFTMSLGKKRQPDMKPISLEIVGRVLNTLPDMQGNPTPTAVAVPLSDAAAENKQASAEEFREQIMRTIDRLSRLHGSVKKPMIAAELCVSAGELRYPMDILAGKRGSTAYITGSPIRITKAGKDYLKEITRV